MHRKDALVKEAAVKTGSWQKKPGVRYRQCAGDTHFKPGMNLEAIESVLQDVLQWESYKRDESRFMSAGECWNIFHEKNGYDLGEVVRDFLVVNGFEKLAPSEVLWSEERAGVGEATVFFSHVQQLPVATALETLREATKVYVEEIGANPIFFIDYMCIRQAQKGDFDLKTVRQAIHDIPRLLIELDGEKDERGFAAPAYFGRSFCIFEVFAAVECDTDGAHKVLVLGPAVKDPRTSPWLASNVNTRGYNIVNSRDWRLEVPQACGERKD
jgi:hypothetical protein